MKDPTCTACQKTWPEKNHFIGDLGICIAYLHKNQFFPGWTTLVLNRHATELFQLTQEERSELIEEVSCLANALTKVYGAKKINYELLGNQLPHIHWHIIPRLTNDPSPTEPVWLVQHRPISLTSLDLESAIEQIQKQLPCK